MGNPVDMSAKSCLRCGCEVYTRCQTFIYHKRVSSDLGFSDQLIPILIISFAVFHEDKQLQINGYIKNNLRSNKKRHNDLVILHDYCVYVCYNAKKSTPNIINKVGVLE